MAWKPTPGAVEGEGRRRWTRLQVGILVGACLGGVLGLLPGRAGAGDPVTLLVWLALFAPAAGFACGAAGIRPLPYGLAPPGLWAFLLAWADLSSPRDLATPLWGALALAGLHWLGSALGALVGGRWAAGAGAVALVLVLLTGLPVQGGLAAPGAESWGKDHPRLTAAALALFPPGIVLDCAGWPSWHQGGQMGMVYDLAGEDWHPRPRRPLRPALWGPLLFAAGLLLAEGAGRWNARHGHLL